MRRSHAYGAATYPQTKFGSIGIRVEPRLLPVMGGIVLGDDGRNGGVSMSSMKASPISLLTRIRVGGAWCVWCFYEHP